MVNYREVTPADYGLIAEVCTTTFAKIKERATKEWIEQVDLSVVLAYIFNPEHHVYIVEDSYLIAYEVGSAWYSNEEVLMEQLVLSLRPGKPFSVVTDFLEEQAMRHEVSLITVGTALAPSDAALVRLYSRAGYKQEAIALIKRIANHVQLRLRSVKSEEAG